MTSNALSCRWEKCRAVFFRRRLPWFLQFVTNRSHLRFICNRRIASKTEREDVPRNTRNGFSFAAEISFAVIGLLISAGPAVSENTSDWLTGLPREPIHVKAWPGGKKVAVCFILYVEVWGFGHGPNFRPDMVARDPDIVDESFRDDWQQEKSPDCFRRIVQTWCFAESSRPSSSSRRRQYRS